MAPKHPLNIDGLPSGGPAKKFKPDSDGDVEMVDDEEAMYDLAAMGIISSPPGAAGVSSDFDTDVSTDPPEDTEVSTNPLEVEPDPATLLRDLNYDLEYFEYDFADHENAHNSSLFLSSSPPAVGGASKVNNMGRTMINVVSRTGQILSSALKSLIPHAERDAPIKEDLIYKFKRVDNLENEKNGNAKQGWIGVNKALGQGGQGCTRLFVKLDHEGKIIDQIVVKETYESAATWRSLDFWHETRVGKDPREAMIHRMLTLETSEQWERYIIGYKGHSVNHRNKTHRTYMGYVDGGDLHGLFRAQGNSVTHRDKFDPSTSIRLIMPEGVPEAFVWYFLKQMVTAMHRMNNIPLRRYRNKSVIHQDIKPANIFLGRCDPDEFPVYPIMKFGDFGSARITSDDDPKNPHDFNDAVTPGYIAPEMSASMQNVMDDWKLSSATNVWQIATTAVQMMRGTTPRRMNWVTEQDLDDPRPTFTDLRDYSKGLLNILRQMLEIDPQDRPNCQQILDRYYKCKDEWQEMADPNKALRFDSYNRWLHWKEGDGKWGVGTVFENLKRSEDSRLADDEDTEDSESTDDGDGGSEGGGGGGRGGGNEYDGPDSTIKGPEKPQRAKKQPRKRLPGRGLKNPSTAKKSDDDGFETTKKEPKKPPPAEKQPRKRLPGTGPKKPSTAEKKPRKKHPEKAPRKPPVTETDDDGSDTTKKAMKPSEAAKILGKRLPREEPIKPRAGKTPLYGVGKGKRPPEKGPPPGTGKGPPPGTGKGPPAGTGKHPPGGVAPGGEEEETGDEEEEETDDEAEETGVEEGGEEGEAYEYEDDYAYEDVAMGDASTSGSKYEPSTSDIDMEDY